MTRVTLRDLRRAGIAYEDLQGTATAARRRPSRREGGESGPETLLELDVQQDAPGRRETAHPFDVRPVGWRITIPGRPIPHKQFGTRAWREQYQPYLSRIREALQLLLMLRKDSIPLVQRGRLEWEAYLYRGRQPDRTNITKMLEDALRGTIIPDDSPAHLTAHTTGELRDAEGPEDERVEVTVWAA